MEELLLPKIETDVGRQGETCTDIHVCVNKYSVMCCHGDRPGGVHRPHRRSSPPSEQK